MILLLIASFALPIGAFLDGLSTVHFLKNPALHETNPLFGKRPSTVRIFLEGCLLIAGELVFMWYISHVSHSAGSFAGICLLAQTVVHILNTFHNYKLPA